MGGEEHSVAVLDVLEDSVLGAQVAHGERAEVVPHALQMSDVVVEVLANRGELFLPGVVGLALLISFSVGRFQLGQGSLEFLHAVSKKSVALLLQLLDLLLEFFFKLRHFAVASFLVHRNDHVRSKVDDLFEVFGCHVQEVAQARRNALEVPNVRDGCSELDVAHALTADRGLGDLNATALTDDAFEANALVLSTRTLPVTTGSKDLLTKKAVFLGLQGAVVDGFWLLDFAVRPAADVVRRGEANAEGVKCCCFQHDVSLSLVSVVEFLDLVHGRRLEAGGNVDSQLFRCAVELVIRILQRDHLAIR